MNREGCTCVDASRCSGKCTASFDSLPNEKSDAVLIDDFLHALSLVDFPKRGRARGAANAAAFRACQLDLDLSAVA